MQRQSNTTSNYQVFAIDAANGNSLWTMKTNGITCAVGQGGIGLGYMGVADDGAIYAANIVNNANGDAGGGPVQAFFEFIVGRTAIAIRCQLMSFRVIHLSLLAVRRFNAGGDSLHVRGCGKPILRLSWIAAPKTSGTVYRSIAIVYPTDNTMTNWASEYMVGKPMLEMSLLKPRATAFSLTVSINRVFFKRWPRCH